MNSKQARNPTCGLRDVLRGVVDAGSHITASARADQADTETLTRADALRAECVQYSMHVQYSTSSYGPGMREPPAGGTRSQLVKSQFKSSQIKSSLSCLFKRNLFTALHCCHQGSQPVNSPALSLSETLTLITLTRVQQWRSPTDRMTDSARCPVGARRAVASPNCAPSPSRASDHEPRRSAPRLRNSSSNAS